jgi:hypothetical protein
VNLIQGLALFDTQGLGTTYISREKASAGKILYLRSASPSRPPTRFSLPSQATPRSRLTLRSTCTRWPGRRDSPTHQPSRSSSTAVVGAHRPPCRETDGPSTTPPGAGSWRSACDTSHRRCAPWYLAWIRRVWRPSAGSRDGRARSFVGVALCECVAAGAVASMSPVGSWYPYWAIKRVLLAGNNGDGVSTRAVGEGMGAVEEFF